MLKEPEAPRRPEQDENSTRPVSGRGDDRLLLWCLLASVFINFGFGLWMNLADVYGTSRTAAEIKRAPIKIYHPPPIKKKPPPPKPKIPPKVVKIVHIQPRPTPPPPPQHFTVGSKSTAKAAVVVEQSAPPAPPTKMEPVAPEDSTPDKGAPTPPPAPEPPAPPAPVYHAPPAPPAPPPAPVHRPGYSDVKEQDAEALGDFPTPDVPQDADVTTLHPCTVTWDVSESGRAVNVKVTSRSGNSDLDDSCRRAIEGMRFQPAIQDHYPEEQRMSHTWNFSG